MSTYYETVYADPPWNERGGGKIKRGADRHYPTLKKDEIIKAIVTSWAWTPHDNAHLWMWVTNNYLKDGLFVMEALGFRYVTNAVWAKTKMGLGQYLRGKHELLLFGVRGRLPALTKKATTLIGDAQIPITRHSEKPEATYRLIETVSPGPRIEFFARSTRAGWDSDGNEL